MKEAVTGAEGGWPERAANCAVNPSPGQPSHRALLTVLLSLLGSAIPAAAMAAIATAVFTSDPYDLTGLTVGFVVLALVPSLTACAALLRRGWRAWSLAPLGLQLLAMLVVAWVEANGWWLFAAAATSILAAGAALDLLPIGRRGTRPGS